MLVSGGDFLGALAALRGLRAAGYEVWAILPGAEKGIVALSSGLDRFPDDVADGVFPPERLWPPQCGEVAYAVTVPPDEELDGAVARLFGSVGWNRVFQVQFVEADGRRDLIDLNPGIFASMALPIAAGANLPALWVELLLGRRPKRTEYRVGVRFRNERHDTRPLARTALRGRIGKALAGAAPAAGRSTRSSRAGIRFRC